MKEVLFRGKTVDTNEWVQGSLVRALGYLDEDEKFFVIPEDALYYNHGEFDMVKEVRRETVGQFTGFTDKNGKKIFEGDIMQLCSACYPCLVYWDGKGYAWKQNGKRREIDLTREKMDTIGNIYDNPNLMDEAEE